MKGQKMRTQTKDVVKSRRFELVDSKGNVRALLSAEVAGEPTLLMFGDSGKENIGISIVDGAPQMSLGDRESGFRLNISLHDGQPSIAMSDGNGIIRFMVFLEEGAGPCLGLNDVNGIPRTVLKLSNNGDPRIQLFGNDGKASANIIIEENNQILFFNDKNGKSRVSISVNGQNGEPRINLSDAEDRQKIQLGFCDIGTPALALFDKAGEVKAILALDQNGNPTIHDEEGKSFTSSINAKGYE